MLLFCTGVAIAACAPVRTTEPGAVGVERKQYMLVSEKQVEEAAALAYAEELRKAAQKGALNISKAQLDRVRGITTRLIPQTAVFRPDALGWKWEVNLQTSSSLNAYCMPAGKIMVYTGLIEQLNLTDAELATVVGHEIAHALREHGRERISRAYGQQIALWGLAQIAGLGERAVDLANMVAEVTFTLPHSREQEAEADRIGLELIARAGYDPRAAVAVWRKMTQASGARPPEFLSTHPTSELRIKDIESHLPAVIPLYEAARR